MKRCLILLSLVIAAGCTSSGGTPDRSNAPPPAAKTVQIVAGGVTYLGTKDSLALWAPNGSVPGYATGGCSGDDGAGHVWGFSAKLTLDSAKSGSVSLSVVTKDDPDPGEAILGLSTQSVAADGGSSVTTMAATSGTIMLRYNDDGTFSGTATVTPASLSGTFSGQYAGECLSADPPPSTGPSSFDASIDARGEAGGEAGTMWYPDDQWSTAFCSALRSRKGT